MLLAILDRCRKRYPKARFVLDALLGPFADRATDGLYQKLSYWKFGTDWGRVAGRIIPSRIAHQLGILSESEVDVVLDASGFSYGDQWGREEARRFEKSSRSWSKRGTTVVLLPQALGPFTTPAVRRSVRGALTQCSLVFARDTDSYSHASSLGVPDPVLRLCPDLTIGFADECAAHQRSREEQVAIVPNQKMISMRPASASAAYVKLIVACLDAVKRKGRVPFILVHELRSDHELAQRIADAAEGSAEIINENDPIKIKAILGASYAVISSRYHGLVSSLSQGVPSIATSWSHKYKALCDDYGVGNYLLSATPSLDEVDRIVSDLIDPNVNANTRRLLQERAATMRTRVNEMWAEVFGVVENRAQSRFDASGTR